MNLMVVFNFETLVINISSINNHKPAFKVSACTKVQYDALDNKIK